MLGVSTDSALHPTEYEARHFRRERREAVAGLVLCCHGPGEPEPLGVLGVEQKWLSSCPWGVGVPRDTVKAWLIASAERPKD